MRFRFRLVLADHLALCILTGNPGGSSPYRNIFSTIDMRQTHLSMACLSEFSVLSSSVKWIIIQAKFEQMYKGFTEILSQPNSCKEMVTISAIKKHQSSISSVYGMVCTHFILILTYCLLFSIDDCAITILLFAFTYTGHKYTFYRFAACKCRVLSILGIVGPTQFAQYC